MLKEETISASLEDYLEAIALLSREHETPHAHARAIADMLNVKKPSVTNALKVLAQSGHIKYSPNRPVKLTSKGQGAADRILLRHRQLKNFFSGVLQLSKKQSNALACQIEHIIDDKFIERLDVLTEHILHSNDSQKLREHLIEKFHSAPDEKKAEHEKNHNSAF